MTEGFGEFAILLVGFNRPELLEKRLAEIDNLKIKGIKVYVSIDGPRQDHPMDRIANLHITNLLKNRSCRFDIDVSIHKQNLGCDLHIPNAISQAIKKTKALVVIEDDVKIDPTGIESILRRLKFQKAQAAHNPILGISAITRALAPRRNRWRSSPYFTAWGYGISKEFWERHVQFMRDQENYRELEEVMCNSKYWTSLTSRKKNLWRERFLRGNYDYQIQRTMFALNIPATVPLFRFIENEGHGSNVASHTRFDAPRYLRKRVSVKNCSVSADSLISSSVSKLFKVLDSHTWAGEGWMSARGRTRGLRTMMKDFLKYIKRAIN